MRFRIGNFILEWRAAAPLLVSMLAYGMPLSSMPPPLPMPQFQHPSAMAHGGAFAMQSPMPMQHKRPSSSNLAHEHALLAHDSAPGDVPTHEHALAVDAEAAADADSEDVPTAPGEPDGSEDIPPSGRKHKTKRRSWFSWGGWRGDAAAKPAASSSSSGTGGGGAAAEPVLQRQPSAPDLESGGAFYDATDLEAGGGAADGGVAGDGGGELDAPAPSPRPSHAGGAGRTPKPTAYVLDGDDSADGATVPPHWHTNRGFDSADGGDSAGGTADSAGMEGFFSSDLDERGTERGADGKPVRTRRYYRKTLRPTPAQLASLGLQPGVNTITFSVHSSLQGTQSVSSRLFLFDHTTKVHRAKARWAPSLGIPRPLGRYQRLACCFASQHSQRSQRLLCSHASRYHSPCSPPRVSPHRNPPPPISSSSPMSTAPSPSPMSSAT